MVVDTKNQKTFALLYLASGQAPNAANTSDVPTNSQQNTVTKLKSKANFETKNFSLPPKSQLSILLNFFFSPLDIRCFFSQV